MVDKKELECQVKEILENLTNKQKNGDNITISDLFSWIITVEKRLAEHSAYFKILGALGVISLSAILYLIFEILRR